MTKEERLEYLKSLINKKGFKVNEKTNEVKEFDTHEDIEQYSELVTIYKVNNMYYLVLILNIFAMIVNLVLANHNGYEFNWFFAGMSATVVVNMLMILMFEGETKHE